MQKELKNNASQEFKGLIESYYQKQEYEGERRHAESVVHWFNALLPNQSPILQIGAYAHDIDRIILPRSTKGAEEDYSVYKQRHALRSAEIIQSHMLRFAFDDALVQDVFGMVAHHESGGNFLADILKDADSISFFHMNLTAYRTKFGETVTNQKIDFMYDRASARAKNFIDHLLGN